MRLYLKMLVDELRHHSISLKKQSILVNKPWTMIDEENEMQRLIFESNNQLVISKNGQVQMGSWDYYPEAKSILINRVTDRILLNEAFIDKGVMILKMDGTQNRFFVFANENLVPDLDVDRYLKELRHKKLKIFEVKLTDGRILEVQRVDEEYSPKTGDSVTIDATPVKNGKFKSESNQKHYEIKEGRIFKIFTEYSYTNPDGNEIVIEQQNSWKIEFGDNVYMYGKQVKSGKINFSNSKNLIVRDGKVVRVERKNFITRFLSNSFKKFIGTYNE